MGSERPRIRRAEADDAATVASLLQEMVRELGGDLEEISTEADIRAHGFSEAPLFNVVLAEKEGHAVGMVVSFLTYSTWTAQTGVYVQDIHVSAPFRGTGLADRLLAAAARAGRARGAKHLRLSVDPDNLIAQRFYRRAGLQPRDDETIFQASGPRFNDLADRADDE